MQRYLIHGPVDGCPVRVKDIIETAALPAQMNGLLFEGRRDGATARREALTPIGRGRSRGGGQRIEVLHLRPSGM